MNHYCISVSVEDPQGKGYDETFRIKATCAEAVYLIAIARHLHIDFDESTINTAESMSLPEIRDVLNSFQLEEELLGTLDLDELALAIEDGYFSFDYRSNHIYSENLEVVDELNEAIMTEVMVQLKKHPVFASAEFLSNTEILIDGGIASLFLRIKGGKLLIKFGEDDVLIGSLELANPNFPSNIYGGIVGSINNLIRSDPILSLGYRMNTNENHG